jgi:hypothetical protein
MKKVLSFIAIAAVATSFVACGPSKAELEKKAKAKADSIRIADSIASEKMAAEAREKQIKDSTDAAMKAIADAEAAHKDSVDKKLIKEPKKK